MRKGLSDNLLKKYPKELLQKEYQEKQKSFRQLNKEFGINGRSVKNLLIHYGIPIRYGSEAIQSQRIGEKGKTRRINDRNNSKYRIITSDGYYAVMFSGDHKGKCRGRIKEHILIIEDKIGRRLEDGEVVHHIDGNKLNNAPGNLKLMTKSEHHKLHYQNRKIDKNGHLLPL